MTSPKELSDALNCPPCKKCKNPETYRIPRSFIFKTLMPWLPIKRYVCFKCLNKFHVFN